MRKQSKRKRQEAALVEQMGEGLHTALRKACESPESHDAWVAISRMPDAEWNDALRWAAPHILDAVLRVR